MNADDVNLQARKDIKKCMRALAHIENTDDVKHKSDYQAIQGSLQTAEHDIATVVNLKTFIYKHIWQQLKYLTL